MIESGLKPSALFIGLEVIICDPIILKYLELENGSKVYKICRLRLANDELFAYETSYIPYAITDNLNVEEIQNDGLYNTIKKYSGFFPDEAVEEFEAVIASNEVASFLKVEKNLQF